MCLAIPAEIIEIQDEMATVRVGDALRKASLLLLPEPAQLGEFVIVHAGFALNTIDEAEAGKILEYLDEIDELGGLGETGS